MDFWHTYSQTPSLSLVHMLGCLLLRMCASDQMLVDDSSRARDSSASAFLGQTSASPIKAVSSPAPTLSRALTARITGLCARPGLTPTSSIRLTAMRTRLNRGAATNASAASKLTLLGNEDKENKLTIEDKENKHTIENKSPLRISRHANSSALGTRLSAKQELVTRLREHSLALDDKSSSPVTTVSIKQRVRAMNLESAMESAGSFSRSQDAKMKAEVKDALALSPITVTITESVSFTKTFENLCHAAKAAELAAHAESLVLLDKLEALERERKTLVVLSLGPGSCFNPEAGSKEMQPEYLVEKEEEHGQVLEEEEGSFIAMNVVDAGVECAAPLRFQGVGKTPTPSASSFIVAYVAQFGEGVDGVV